jgi:hypothetical protein
MSTFKVGDRVVFLDWHDHHMREHTPRPGVIEAIEEPLGWMGNICVRGDDGEAYFGDDTDMRPA